MTEQKKGMGVACLVLVMVIVAIVLSFVVEWMVR